LRIGIPSHHLSRLHLLSSSVGTALCLHLWNWYLSGSNRMYSGVCRNSRIRPVYIPHTPAKWYLFGNLQENTIPETGFFFQCMSAHTLHRNVLTVPLLLGNSTTGPCWMCRLQMKAQLMVPGAELFQVGWIRPWAVAWQTGPCSQVVSCSQVVVAGALIPQQRDFAVEWRWFATRALVRAGLEV